MIPSTEEVISMPRNFYVRLVKVVQSQWSDKERKTQWNWRSVQLYKVRVLFTKEALKFWIPKIFSRNSYFRFQVKMVLVFSGGNRRLIVKHLFRASNSASVDCRHPKQPLCDSIANE